MDDEEVVVTSSRDNTKEEDEEELEEDDKEEEIEEPDSNEEQEEEIVVTKVSKKGNGNVGNQRNTWARLYNTWIVNGEQVEVYPWLEDDSNHKDRAFIGMLSLYRLYKVEYGKKTKVGRNWRSISHQNKTCLATFASKKTVIPIPYTHYPQAR